MEPGIYILSGISPLATQRGDFGYYGLSIHPEQRLEQHLSALKHGKHTNKLIQQFHNEHGRGQFYYGIVEECDIDQIVEREKHYIAQGQTYVNPSGFNLSRGGEGVGGHDGKLYGFEDTRDGMLITGQNLALFQRFNQKYDLQQLYRLSRGEIECYEYLKLAPWHQPPTGGAISF
jgi:hypothetical protein